MGRNKDPREVFSKLLRPSCFSVKESLWCKKECEARKDCFRTATKRDMMTSCIWQEQEHLRKAKWHKERIEMYRRRGIRPWKE